MNWMRVNILTRKRILYLHGQTIETPSLERWVDHVDPSQHDMVTGNARDESLISRRLGSETLAYSEETVGKLHLMLRIFCSF
jgi:hypothetical protein